LTHGLTASILIDQVFPDGELDALRREFREQWQPRTPTARVLVDDLSRHGAALKLAERIERAVLRQGARAGTALCLISETPADETEEILLNAAVSTPALECLTRYRRSHEKAFNTTLARLREIQADTAQAAIPPRGRHGKRCFWDGSGVRRILAPSVHAIRFSLPRLRQQPRFLVEGAPTLAVCRLQTTAGVARGHSHGRISSTLAGLIPRNCPRHRAT
jgi:hypothetical protein